ncbi:MAG: zinc ribbon domain-containing protein [Candidatus Korarchaeum sp.]
MVYVNARSTSICPIRGARLSPNGHRIMRCPRCGSEDRDVMAVKNLLKERCGDFIRSP